MKNVETVKNLSTTPPSEFSNRQDVPDADLAQRHFAGWAEPNRRDAYVVAASGLSRRRREASYSFLIGITFDFFGE